MTDESAQNPRVSDDRDMFARERRGEADGAVSQLRHGFTARRNEIEDVGRPGIEGLPVDPRPRPAFPFAKIDFAQPVVNANGRIQRFGELACPSQRTRKHRDTRGQMRADTRRGDARQFRIYIATPVADAGFDQRARVPDQENLHNSPA